MCSLTVVLRLSLPTVAIWNSTVMTDANPHLKWLEFKRLSKSGLKPGISERYEANKKTQVGSCEMVFWLRNSEMIIIRRISRLMESRRDQRVGIRIYLLHFVDRTNLDRRIVEIFGSHELH